MVSGGGAAGGDCDGHGEARPVAAAAAEEVVPGGGSVQALVEAAAAVILTLRRCAEARKQRSEGKNGGEGEAWAAAGLTALGTEQCVAAAMEELKRRVLLLLAGAGGGEEAEEEAEEEALYEEALGLLEEIQGSVAFLQRELSL